MTSGTFFQGRAAPAGQPDSVGGAILQGRRQFLPPPADGVDMQPGDAGDEPIAAVSELGTLDGGIPAALLLIEPAEQQVHLPVELLLGVRPRAETVGALAAMNFPLGHGRTLRDVASRSIPAYQKLGTCPWMSPLLILSA